MTKRIILFFTFVLFAIWWGGFTFYATIVVPQGFKILGDHIKMGMITQSVTNYLNGIGSVVIFISAIVLISNNNKAKSPVMQIGWEWYCLVLLQAALFYVHHLLSLRIQFISPDTMLEKGFYQVHRVYLLISSAVWFIIPFHFYKLNKAMNN